MDPAKVKRKRGCKAAATVARKALAIARKGVAVIRAGATLAPIRGLRMVRTVYWLVYVIGNNDAASPADTVLAAIVQFGEILARLAT